MFEANGHSCEEAVAVPAVAAAAVHLPLMLRCLVEHGYEPSPPEMGDHPCGWWEILTSHKGGLTSHRDEGACVQLLQSLPKTDCEAVLAPRTKQATVSGLECIGMKLADLTEIFGYSSDAMTLQQLATRGIYETADW